MKLFGFDIGVGNSLKDKLYWLITGWMTKHGFVLWGGGSPGPVTTTSTSTNLPTYAQPYFDELLKQTGKAVFDTNAAGQVTGIKQYVPYTGERVAGFTPEQIATQQAVMNMQAPTEFAQAQQGLAAGQAGGYGAAQAGLSKALGYTPNTIAAQNVYAPDLQQYGMQAAQTAYNPQLSMYQMQGPQNVYAQRASSQMFTPQAAAYYGDPYQQGVTNIALREAALQGAKDKQAGMLGSIGRGTFGGARQALLQAEQQRGLNQNLADIQAKGSQAGYENAQKQFLADQANRMAAQQLNVQSGLQAQLANQQAQQQTGQQNLQAALGVQQLGTQTGTQLALANLSNAQQANVQNLAAQLQTQGLSADQAMKAALANQQSNLQAQTATQQAQLAAAQLAGQTGIAGLQAGLEGSKALGALGATEQTAQLERLKAQAATGAEKQALQQKIDDLAYQTFQEKQNYQRTLLEYYSNILRGNAGALGSTQVAYTPAPSTISQIGGLGLAGLGLAKALG